MDGLRATDTTHASGDKWRALLVYAGEGSKRLTWEGDKCVLQKQSQKRRVTAGT